MRMSGEEGPVMLGGVERQDASQLSRSLVREEKDLEIGLAKAEACYVRNVKLKKSWWTCGEGNGASSSCACGACSDEQLP